MSDIEDAVEVAERSIVHAERRHSQVCLIDADDLKKLIEAAKSARTT